MTIVFIYLFIRTEERGSGKEKKKERDTEREREIEGQRERETDRQTEREIRERKGERKIKKGARAQGFPIMERSNVTIKLHLAANYPLS